MIENSSYEIPSIDLVFPQKNQPHFNVIHFIYL